VFSQSFIEFQTLGNSVVDMVLTCHITKIAYIVCNLLEMKLSLRVDLEHLQRALHTGLDPRI
jgi:hypothetical protein